MPLYEHVYLARQDASAQQVEELTAHLKSVVEGLGGSIAKTAEHGRHMAGCSQADVRRAELTRAAMDTTCGAMRAIAALLCSCEEKMKAPPISGPAMAPIP